MLGGFFHFLIINFCCCWCCFFNCSQKRQTHGRHWRRRRWTIHKAKKQQEEDGDDHRNKNKQAAHFQININVRNMRESSKRKWIEIYTDILGKHVLYMCLCLYVSVCVCVSLNAQQQIKASQLSARTKEPIHACLYLCVCLCERALNQESGESEREWAQVAPAAEPPQHLIKYCSMGNCFDCCLCFETSEKKSKALECTNNKKKEKQKGKEKTETETELSNCLIVKTSSVCSHNLCTRTLIQSHTHFAQYVITNSIALCA